MTMAASILAVLLAPVVAQQTEWPTFNGNLAARKYSKLDQITLENIGKLETAWQTQTGDVPDDGGDIPATVWSATPVLTNDTLYVGTPCCRIFGVEPDTGVVCRQASDGPTGRCSKRDYLGMMGADLNSAGAGSGKLCTDVGGNSIIKPEVSDQLVALALPEDGLNS